MDRRIRGYLKETDHKKWQNNSQMMRAIKEFQKEKAGSDHGTAGQLNVVLSLILEGSENNTSIIGSNSECKIIRNKISHSNIFYDSDKNTIKVSGGQEYTIEEFANEFGKIFGFLVRWMTLGFILSNKTLPDNLDYDRKDIHKIVRGIRREAMKQLRYLAKQFQKINCMPAERIEYHRLVMKWVKED